LHQFFFDHHRLTIFDMYAIFRAAGKQFRAEPGATLRLPSLAAEAGDTITFDEVLLGANGGDFRIGAPLVSGAAVTAEVVGHGRGEKIIIFKHKRRKNYRRKLGHRQGFTEVRVSEINLG
jgi:large subunit ribosomal protein L21